MILSYTLPNAENLIRCDQNPDGTKIHTFRRDEKNRWRAGMTIQHWNGSPRNPKGNPFKIGDGVCHGIELIEIYRAPSGNFKIVIDGKEWNQGQINVLDIFANNDGFATTADFAKWFVPGIYDYWKGKIIHFTPFRYGEL